MTTRRIVAFISSILLLVIGAAALRFFLQYRALDPSCFDQRHSNRVNLDLLEDAARARVERETGKIVFGSPEGKRHYHEPDPRLHDRATGFRSFATEEGESCAALVGDDARVQFTVLREGPRLVTVQAAGIADGQGPQQVEVRVNDHAVPVATIELAASDQVGLGSFEIPAELLRDGTNELRFSCARLLSWTIKSEGLTYPIGAVFRRIDIERLAGEPPAPPPSGPDLAVENVAGVGGRPGRLGLVFRQGSRVSFAMRLPDGRPRLAASFFIHPDDRGNREVPVIARLRAEPAGRLLLCKTRLAGATAISERQPVDLDVDLSLFRGAVVAIEFEAEEAPPGCPPWRIVVAEPTIRGGDPDPPPPVAPATRLEDLRGRLRGKNLVLITVDAAAARHFTAYGAPVENAPGIDTVARDGVVFEDTTSPASYTLAAIGSMFTGLFPDNHGIVAAGTEQGAVRLSSEVPVLAELLRDHGYGTMAMVTNPNAGAEYGYGRGFDVYDALYDRELGFWDEGVKAELLAPRLEEHLNEGGLAEPYFLYVHVFQPHAPYRPPADYREGLVDEDYDGPADGSRESIDAYRAHQSEPWRGADFENLRALYDANIRYADAAVSEMLELLRMRSKLERTVVAIVADHGEALGQHGTVEHGDTVFTEQVEVPWILGFPPGTDIPPARVPGPCSLVDLTPTLLGLFGIETTDIPFQGVDLTARLLGATAAERPLFLRSSGIRPRFGVRRLGHSYHEDLGTRECRLYDLTSDPLEETPIGLSDSVFAEYLRAELCRYLCAQVRHKVERFSASAEHLEQLREIGYLGVETDGTPCCPLARRAAETR